MAIPIEWPVEESDDAYLSLDVMLEQLLVTLRQILAQRRLQEISNLSVRRKYFYFLNMYYVHV